MAYTTIKKPSDYFNTVLYAGNGSTQSITGVNFQPDLVYVKGRNTSSKYPTIFDSVRGATKRLTTFSTNVEDTHPTMLSSFDSDGWTSGADDQTNASGTNYVCWNWLASNTTASNTDGSITSTVSANTTSGFSIVSYTGTGSAATVGHGLGVAPKMIITKTRNTVDSWYVYHTSLGASKRLGLNAEDAAATSSTYWNDTEPTNSVFSLNTNSGNNGSGVTMIAYCFADVKGFSKFGSYTGNGSTDGTFVYTGFKPAFVMIKVTNVSQYWTIFDNKREGYNVTGKTLFPNLSNSEGSFLPDGIDFVSNGIKFRSDATAMNASGNTYIYMAFAENPLVGDNPATAR